MSSGTQRTCQGPPSDDLARADTLYRGGDYATAAALLLTLLSSGPLLPGARRLLGLCRLREGQVQEAIDLLDAARTEEPDNPWAALHYALGLQAAGRHRDAADLLRPCCAALGPDPTPWLNLSCS
ncbi:MAG TPA: tetratricopeptide repeat protein, partial [Rhodopila sp.]|uniref:tetratricopeptide repeat protein n=1 Tax=Rhodopila sp. TaxID=2480087 RepID=UPI002B70D2A8